jgi:hypothetical protein
MKIAMGGALFMAPEEALAMDTLELIRRYDDLADRHDEEPGSAAIRVEKVVTF